MSKQIEVMIRNSVVARAASKLDGENYMRTASYVLEAFSNAKTFFGSVFAEEIGRRVRDGDYEQNNHWTTFTLEVA